MIHFKKTGTIHTFFSHIEIVYRTLGFGNYGGSKLTKCHWAKEKKKTSLSNQTSVYALSPEGGVVWNVPYHLELELMCF